MICHLTKVERRNREAYRDALIYSNMERNTTNTHEIYFICFLQRVEGLLLTHHRPKIVSLYHLFIKAKFFTTIILDLRLPFNNLVFNLQFLRYDHLIWKIYLIEPIDYAKIIQFSCMKCLFCLYSFYRKELLFESFFSIFYIRF